MLIKGFLTGLLFGVPVGAVGALTVQRTWQSGIRAGLLTGSGSSAADCLYACVGAFGLGVVSDFLFRYQAVITAFGGIFLLTMGLNALLRPRNGEPAEHSGRNDAGLFFTSFVVGITNPAAILTFLFAFSYFGISEIRGLSEGVALVLGVFAGTYFWWITLTYFTEYIKKKSKPFSMVQMNRVFGGILCAFGMVIVVSLLLT